LATSFARRIFNQGKKVSTKPITNMKVRIDGQDHTRFTELLEPTMLNSIHSLSHCPLIFQEYIPKAYELRVTVIGNEIFAACIQSQSAGGDTTVDWRRYNIPKTPHYAYELSPELRNQILALHQRLGLVYSSFDFIRTPQGEFVFLETNPFGQWLWIEDLTGLPISKAIADFLSAPSL
jgi:glutathione synthase/RimK-type ligase-like ATP-grasp enzyme